MKVVDIAAYRAQRNSVEPFACPIGIALWEEYRRHNPDGLKVPPTDGDGVTDPELFAYLDHSNSCDDCNEV
jgi:hypothetical protein